MRGGDLPIRGEFGEENPDELRRQTVHAEYLVPESPVQQQNRGPGDFIRRVFRHLRIERLQLLLQLHQPLLLVRELFRVELLHLYAIAPL